MEVRPSSFRRKGQLQGRPFLIDQTEPATVKYQFDQTGGWHFTNLPGFTVLPFQPAGFRKKHRSESSGTRVGGYDHT